MEQRIKGIDDREAEQIPNVSEVCIHCAHLERKRRCKAFSGLIPLEIWLGRNDHKKPVKGDHGIQFKKFEIE